MDQVREFEWGDGSGTIEKETAVEAVVRAVMDARDRAPDELEPLQNVVDAEALNELFRHAHSRRSTALTVSFTYEGYEITLDPSTVTLQPLACASY